MNKKTFQWARIIVPILLAVAGAIGVINKNYVIPLVAMVVAIIILYIIKSRNKDVLQDERSYRIASAAARAAIGAFAVTAAVISFILLGIESSPVVKAVGETLSYSVSSLLILYLIFYKFYSGKM